MLPSGSTADVKDTRVLNVEEVIFVAGLSSPVPRLWTDVGASHVDGSGVGGTVCRERIRCTPVIDSHRRLETLKLEA